VDCVETEDPCTAACQGATDRNYTVLTLAVKLGKVCTGPTNCLPGDGTCPTVAAAAALEPPNTRLSGGAVAGIVISILLVVGAIVWWFRFGSKSGGVRRAREGLKTELEMVEIRRNTMDMEENPLAAAKRARARGKNATANNPLVAVSNTPAIDDSDYDMPSEEAATAPLTISSTIYADYAPGMDNGAAYAPVDTDDVLCARGTVPGGKPCTHIVGAAVRFCPNHTCNQAGCFNTKSSSAVACNLHGARLFDRI